MEKGIDRESKWKTEKRDDVKRKGETRSKSSKIEVFFGSVSAFNLSDDNGAKTI